MLWFTQSSKDAVAVWGKLFRICTYFILILYTSSYSILFLGQSLLWKWMDHFWFLLITQDRYLDFSLDFQAIFEIIKSPLFDFVECLVCGKQQNFTTPFLLSCLQTMLPNKEQDHLMSHLGINIQCLSQILFKLIILTCLHQSKSYPLNHYLRNGITIQHGCDLLNSCFAVLWKRWLVVWFWLQLLSLSVDLCRSKYRLVAGKRSIRVYDGSLRWLLKLYTCTASLSYACFISVYRNSAWYIKVELCNTLRS